MVEDLIIEQREIAARQIEMQHDVAFLIEKQRTLLSAAKHILEAASVPEEDRNQGRAREPPRQRHHEQQRDLERVRPRGNGDIDKERCDSRVRERHGDRGGSRGRDPRDPVNHVGARQVEEYVRVCRRSSEPRRRSPLRRRRADSPPRRGVVVVENCQLGARGANGRSQSEEAQWQRSRSPRHRSPSGSKLAQKFVQLRSEEAQLQRSMSPRPRSPSGSDFTLNVTMSHDSMQDDSCTFEEAHILERQSGPCGDCIWQAEIEISKNQLAPNGTKRTFTVRGPPRKNKELAEEDSKKMEAATNEGAKAVRSLANKLHRG